MELTDSLAADLVAAIEAQLDKLVSKLDLRSESFHNALKQHGVAMEAKLANLCDEIRLQPRTETLRISPHLHRRSEHSSSNLPSTPDSTQPSIINTIDPAPIDAITPQKLSIDVVPLAIADPEPTKVFEMQQPPTDSFDPLAEDLVVVIETIGDGPYTISYVTTRPPPSISRETKANIGEEVTEPCHETDLIPVITDFPSGDTTTSESALVPVVTQSHVAIREKLAAIDNTIHTALGGKEGKIQEFVIAPETKSISSASRSTVASTAANKLTQPRNRNFVKDRGKGRQRVATINQDRRQCQPRTRSVIRHHHRHRHRIGGRANLWPRHMLMKLQQQLSESSAPNISESLAVEMKRRRIANFVKDRGRVLHRWSTQCC